MLTILIIWLIVDVIAVIILLYDFNRWYRDDRELSLASDETESSKVQIS